MWYRWVHKPLNTVHQYGTLSVHQNSYSLSISLFLCYFNLLYIPTAGANSKIILRNQRACRNSVRPLAGSRSLYPMSRIFLRTMSRSQHSWDALPTSPDAVKSGGFAAATRQSLSPLLKFGVKQGFVSQHKTSYKQKRTWR